MNEGNKTLQIMKENELREVARKLEIRCEESDTNAILIQRINESGLYTGEVEKDSEITGEVVKGVKTHPTFGKYYDVIVRPIKPEDQNTTIFVSINTYIAEFFPGVKVSLPLGIIKFLKSSITAEHYFDAQATSDLGNHGMHKTRYVPKYIIEKVDSEI